MKIKRPPEEASLLFCGIMELMEKIKPYLVDIIDKCVFSVYNISVRRIL
jgi:hypothetical protein